MIVVVAKVQTDAERRDELVRIGQAAAAKSREEAGCIDYRLYQATDDPLSFVMVEEWESQEALDAHFRTDHIREFMGAVPKLVSAPPDIRFHDVSGTRTLGDVRG